MIELSREVSSLAIEFNHNPLTVDGCPAWRMVYKERDSKFFHQKHYSQVKSFPPQKPSGWKSWSAKHLHACFGSPRLLCLCLCGVSVVLHVFPKASIYIPIGQTKPAQSKSAEKVLPILSVDFSLSAIRHHTSIVDFYNKGPCPVKGHHACCPRQPAICLRMKACQFCAMSCDGCPVLQ
jgi:hypothetical protein